MWWHLDTGTFFLSVKDYIFIKCVNKSQIFKKVKISINARRLHLQMKTTFLNELYFMKHKAKELWEDRGRDEKSYK